MDLLKLFVALQIGKFSIESLLSWMNKSYYENSKRQETACNILNIERKNFEKALSYSRDKYWFNLYSGVANISIFLAFLWFGGFSLVEVYALKVSQYFGQNEIVTGLAFFGILGLCSSFISLPFDYYYTFVIEGKHGFNRQTVAGFFGDWIKGLVLGMILGSLLLGGLFWVMQKMGSNWWIWAWLVVSFFQLLILWLYPSLLAPLFNKFSPVKDGELKDEIYSLAKKVNFKATGLFTMDASKRSTHGNAYFTGVFNEKRIVLFDTLIDTLSVREITAVLAHELGHFKLNHVRWMIIRGTLMMGAMFYALSVCLPLESFYTSFHLKGVSNYGALLIFSMWFGLVGFIFSPFGSWISRRNEFAADYFAIKNMANKDLLPAALLKLSESNHSMPLVHPIYSFFYHSHPPIMERIEAINQIKI